MMFDLWPVYSGKRFRASWSSHLKIKCVFFSFQYLYVRFTATFKILFVLNRLFNFITKFRVVIFCLDILYFLLMLVLFVSALTSVPKLVEELLMYISLSESTKLYKSS